MQWNRAFFRLTLHVQSIAFPPHGELKPSFFDESVDGSDDKLFTLYELAVFDLLRCLEYSLQRYLSRRAITS